jgi:hypothetical protein
MEASNATGLSVLDADRRIAETPFSSKVVAPCDYTPPMCEVLQEEAARILRELGLTVTRSVLELRVPFITKAIHLNVERWLKGPGDSIASGDVICELRLLGTRRMTRPTSALFLASIGGGKPLIRRVFSRERMLRRRKDVKMSVVSSDAGVLRQILRREGDAVKTNDPLALLTDREDTLFGSDGQPSIFRAVARSDDVSSELLL